MDLSTNNVTGTAVAPPIDPRTIKILPIAPPGSAGAKGEKGEGSAIQAAPTNPTKEGEAGTAAPFTPFPTNAEFVAAVFGPDREHGVPLVCSKQGDPTVGGWIAAPVEDVERQCPPSHNNYVNCSTFRPEDGQLRATKEQFGAYHCLVFDDVGTKVSADGLGSFEASWKIETSPGNWQVGVLLDPPIKDAATVERLQKAVVKAGLSDPGASGVARWVRLPKAINGKAKYRSKSGDPFVCRLDLWQPDRRYTLDEIAAGLGLSYTETEKPNASVGHALERADDEVCTYPKTISPVVLALQSRNLYKREISPGKHDITCPWVEEHTDQIDGGACFMEPSKGFPAGGFKCHHSHGDRLSIRNLIEHLEVAPSDARNRRRIKLLPGSMLRILSAAEEALAETQRIFQSGGIIVAVRKSPDGKDPRTEPLTPESLMMEMAGSVEWERYDAKAKEWVLTDPQLRHANQLLRAQSYSHLPVLRGLARQPYLREADGVMVLSPGYDPVSKVYAVFDPAPYRSIGASRQDAEAALARLSALLEEFHFETEADRSAALCAMITGVIRPSLPLAPAFNITASRPGSGKSYLASIIAKFATAGDPLNVSYPRTSEEATKSILSHLLQGPAVIMFDDMDYNWKAFGPINRMLTSETVTDRLLGGNKSATVATRVLVMGTGNNVEPERDLRRRVLSIRIESKSENPALLRYRGNPLGAVSGNRAGCVSDVLTLVAAWRNAGSPQTPVFAIASYGGPWSDLCRQPLLWLGLPDPAERLREQLVNNPDDEALGCLLTAWHASFGGQPTTVRKLLDRAESIGGDALKEAFEELPSFRNQGINRSSFGWYLKKNLGRIVGELKLEKACSSERKAWRVVSTADHGPTESAPPFTSFEGGEGGVPEADGAHF